MSRKLLQQVIGVIWVILFVVGCAGALATTHVAETPAATPVPASPTATPVPPATIPTPEPPTRTPIPPTATPTKTPTLTSSPVPLLEELRIKKYPDNFTCFKLETSMGVTIITDPYKITEDTSADIVTISHYHSDHADFSHLTGAYRLIDTAGAFSEKGVKIIGVAGHHNKGDVDTTNIIYVFDFNGIRLAQFASQGDMPTAEMFAQIGTVDVLIIQFFSRNVGEKLAPFEANSIAQRLHARIIIPAHGDLGSMDRLEALWGKLEHVSSGELVVKQSELADLSTPRVILLDRP